MSTEQFRPVEMTRKYPAWPFAVMGAAIVALIILLARKETAGAPMKQVASANIGSKIDAKAIADAILPAKAPELETPPKSEPKTASPNVIGQPASRTAMVPATEVERERARARGAQKAVATYKKHVDALEKQLIAARSELSQTRAELSALRNPRQPPPTDQEQILRTLVPVLQTSSNAP